MCALMKIMSMVLSVSITKGIYLYFRFLRKTSQLYIIDMVALISFVLSGEGFQGITSTLILQDHIFLPFTLLNDTFDSKTSLTLITHNTNNCTLKKSETTVLKSHKTLHSYPYRIFTLVSKVRITSLTFEKSNRWNRN